MPRARFLSVLAGLFVLASVAPDVVAAQRNVNSCQVIDTPGSYVLTRNLSASGDCLTVNADFVTIDLAGFTIFGNGTGDGIRGGAERIGVTMRNGSITNFDDGIDFCLPFGGPATPGHQMVIERIRAVSNANSGICLQSSNPLAGLTVRNSDASMNGGAGMELGGRALVEGNVVSNNVDGINISGSATITGNTIVANSNAGIITGNHSFDIVNNRVQGTAIGIQVFCPSVILGNVIGGAVPLSATPSAGVCTIEHNTLNPF